MLRIHLKIACILLRGLSCLPQVQAAPKSLKYNFFTALLENQENKGFLTSLRRLFHRN